jgi:hypothetical protein
MPAYMALTPALVILNRLVSAELSAPLTRSRGEGFRAQSLRILVAAGVAELHTIKEVEQTPAISSSIKDDYIMEENGPTDVLTEPPLSPVSEKMRRIRKSIHARMAKKECTAEAPFIWPSVGGNVRPALLPNRRHSVPARIFSAV